MLDPRLARFASIAKPLAVRAGLSSEQLLRNLVENGAVATTFPPPFNTRQIQFVFQEEQASRPNDSSGPVEFYTDLLFDWARAHLVFISCSPASAETPDAWLAVFLLLALEQHRLLSPCQTGRSGTTDSDRVAYTRAKAESYRFAAGLLEHMTDGGFAAVIGEARRVPLRSQNVDMDAMFRIAGDFCGTLPDQPASLSTCRAFHRLIAQALLAELEGPDLFGIRLRAVWRQNRPLFP